MTEFTDIVERHLTRLEWRRLDLARRSDYSASYITNMMNGLRTPTPGAVTRIASTLGLSETAAEELHEAAARLRGYMVRRSERAAAPP